MKKTVLLFLLISTFTQAQFTVKGTMNPPYKSDWVILYKIEGARQLFVKNLKAKKDSITVKGKKQVVANFQFTLPENTQVGTYRISYDTKGKYFLDFIFNKENIAFQFHPQYPEQTIVFTESKENQLYNEYLNAIYSVQKKLDNIQVKALKKKATKDDFTYYKKQITEINKVQQNYLNKSKGMLVNHFIKAGARRNAPELMVSMQKYLDYMVQHFFDAMDFNDQVLYKSSFLVDRINDYVFYLNYSENEEVQQKLYKQAIQKVMPKITSNTFKKDVIEFLITQFEARKNVTMVDYLFDNYYSKLPKNLQDSKFKKEKLANLRAEVGRIAPDFSWKENNKTYSLTTLNDANTYLLIFWSTKCAHCTIEIPKVYNFLKDKKDVKVIAFAMEDDNNNWKKLTPNLKGWHHILGLGRWQNKTARTYQIFSTPSYFILDKNKKIIAKPEHLKDVKKIFTKKIKNN